MQSLNPVMRVGAQIGECLHGRGADRRGRIARLLEGVGLPAKAADKYPCQLSGGQQQRVALARLLVSDPRILLLDEPFSALDSHLRFRMEQEVTEILRGFGKTVIFVSHARDEVYRISDKIAVMNGGTIEVIGDKKAVFADPVTVNAARLTGCKNISAVRSLGGGRVFAEEWGIEISVPDKTAEYVGVRMHDISYGTDGENHFRCRVVSVTENPFSYTVMLKPTCADENAQPIAWDTDKAAWQSIAADEIDITIDPQKVILLKG
jgi:molybdate transport system ATP-binding protein